MPTDVRLRCRYYRYFPQANPLGHAHEVITLAASETAFVLVDVYGRGFDDGDTGTASELYRSAIAKNQDIVGRRIAPARDAARRLGIPIIYVTNHLSSTLTRQTVWHGVNLRSLNVDVFEEWREPNDILAFSAVIEPGPGDFVVRKQYYSGFFETALDSLLRSLNIRNLVVVGFDTRICLGLTVTDAMYRGYRVVVLRDCTSSLEYEETKEEGLATAIGIRYIETAVGYTAIAEDWLLACATPADG